MSIHKSAATGYAHRQSRNSGSALAACALIAAGVLAGCSSPAPGLSSAAPAQSPVIDAGARVFTSVHYGYTVALPAGWSAQGAQPWDGPGRGGRGRTA